MTSERGAEYLALVEWYRLQHMVKLEDSRLWETMRNVYENLQRTAAMYSCRNKESLKAHRERKLFGTNQSTHKAYSS